MGLQAHFTADKGCSIVIVKKGDPPLTGNCPDTVVFT